MAARAYWTGQIRLSLVSLPVNIFPALSSARTLPLHEIYRKTGERVKHQNVADDKPIEREDIVKGYEYSKGRYVLIEPEEIKELKLPSKNVLEIVQFVPQKEIDPLYFEKPYFVVPKEDSSEEAFAVIRDALSRSGTYGLGQLVIGGRERLCALKPCGRGMLLDTIRYHDEIRKADNYFDSIDNVKVDKDQLALAERLIKQKTGHFKPDKFHDHYREALRELINAKLEHRQPEYEEAKPAAKVSNLMDALKRSLGDKPANDNRKTAKKSAAKKPAKVTSIPRPKAKKKTAHRKAS